MKSLGGLFQFLCLVFCATFCVADSSEKKSPNSYNPIGKRDPFKVLNAASTGRKLSSIYPTEKYDLEQLNLKAILRIGGRSRAMIEAPDGKTFIVYEGEVVGRERATLSRILKTEIIFSQKTFNYLGNASLVEHVLSLPSEAAGSGLEDLFEKQETGSDASSDAKREGSGVNPLKDNVKKIFNKIDAKIGGSRNKSQRMIAGKRPEAGDSELKGQGEFQENVKKIMNRPQQLEKDLDELVGPNEKK